MSAATLAEYVAQQDSLVKEAAEALPHLFSKCTYSLGHIRQAVYLCRECPEAKGLCSACSVACHTNHDQIELFPKRGFRCDCPTSSISHQCTLHPKLEEPNHANKYTLNFDQKFCRCRREYDASKERETMVQCLACEDWFHESCCNLRERLPSREPTPEPVVAETSENPEAIDDGASEASSSGLPPPLISGDDYESFVCASCVRTIPTLKRHAGTQGFMMVVRSSPDEPWRILNGSGAEPMPDEVSVGSKRSCSPSSAPNIRKRVKTDDIDDTSNGNRADTGSLCLAPDANSAAQAIFASEDASLGTGDVFILDGFREKWCRCNTCLPSLKAHSYLLEEEDTYEPPEDPDSGLSLEQLGMRALERLPRDRAINGIHAFNKMRDNLLQYLKPFAESGEVVKEDDVRSFFDAFKENLKREKVH